MFKLINNSLKNLKHNKGRTTLTLLGIVIGIFSVVTLLNLGKAAQRYIEDEISSFGSDLLNIVAGNNTRSPFNQSNRSLSDNYFSQTEVESFLNLSKKYIAAAVEEISTTANIQYKENILNSQAIRGATKDYFFVRGYTLKYGREINLEDNQNFKRVIILDEDTSNDIFGDDINPIGNNLRINGTTYRVIGVKAKSDGFLSFSESFIPLSTLRKFVDQDQDTLSISMKAIDSENVDNAKLEAETLLRKVRRLDDTKESNFTINTSQDALETFNNVTNLLTIFLAAIGGISLLVGGIGIMNVMLITVKERTKEIGLRKAIGANAKDIFLQFLAESITVTLLGGVIGLGLGIAVFYIVSKVVSLSFELDPISVILPIIVSSLIGIIFGIYPSVKASKMSPIEALRYE